MVITITSLVRKISSGQTFVSILNFCCDPDLEHTSLIFSQDTSADDLPVTIKLSLVSKGPEKGKIIQIVYVSVCVCVGGWVFVGMREKD